MSRILLSYVLPLLIPVAVYIGWLRLFGHRRDEDEIDQGQWFWVLFAGFLLVAVGLAYLTFSNGGGTEGIYRPSYVKNGKIIPGTISNQ